MGREVFGGVRGWVCLGLHNAPVEEEDRDLNLGAGMEAYVEFLQTKCFVMSQFL